MSDRHPFQVDAASPSRLEALEPRAMLSTAYWTFMTLDGVEGYVETEDLGANIIGASNNGEYFWSLGATESGGGEAAFFIADNTAHYLADIPELSDLFIVDINNDGLVLLRGADSIGLLWDIEDGGEPVSVNSLITDAPDGFDPADVDGMGLGDSGAVILQSGPFDARATYILIDGVVEHLWTLNEYGGGESFVDINATDTVVGHRDQSEPVYWNSESGVQPLTGLSVAGGLNDSGQISGRSVDQIVIWQDGVMTPVGLVDPLPQPLFYKSFYPIDIAADGTLLARATGIAGRGTIRETWVSDGQNTELYQRIVTPIGSVETYTASILESGIILVPNQVTSYPVVGPGYLIPLPTVEVASTEPGNATTIVQTGDTVGIGFFPSAGGYGWYDPAGDSTLGILSANGFFATNSSPIASFIDVHFGIPLLVVPIPISGLTLLGRAQNGALQQYVPGGSFQVPGTVRSFSVMTMPDGRAVIAAVAEDGDIHLLYDVAEPSAPGPIWVSFNLTESHFINQGLDAPEFDGPISAFSTSWGGMNIVGLDASGDVQSVWWGPGMSLWTTSNLSETAGSPTLTGNLAAFSAPWGAMHVAGTDAQGHVQVLWWAPGLVDWQTDDLTELAGGAPVNPGSLAAAVAPWNALSIYATSDDGQVQTLWWAPATNEWTSEAIEVDGGTPLLPGSLAAFTSAEGVQNLSGVTADGEVVRLFWLPEGQDGWQAQNLTELALT